MSNLPRRWGRGAPAGRQFVGNVHPESSTELGSSDLYAAYSYDLGTAGARDALLDVLVALEAHREALVIVGAQAVYERTRHLSGVVPTSTKDGDIAVDPTLLSKEPLIGEAMAGAGFFAARPERPGIYSQAPTPPGGNPVPPTIDLIAPEVIAGVQNVGANKKRGARIEGHGKKVVGRADGIEMAMIDRDLLVIEPMNTSHRTPIEVKVAGVGGLLSAKAWKLHQRFVEADGGKPHRLLPKDAGDVWRLMAVSDPNKIRETFDQCEQHPQFGVSTAIGRQRLIEMFAPGGRGSALAEENFLDQMDGNRVRAVIDAWVARFTA
ncbi:MAG: hypothetical protein ACYDEP_11365 [Acidimicrobiales bacterium]